MLMSQRERYIAGGLGSLLGLVILWYVIISPQMKSWEDLGKVRDKADENLRASAKTLQTAKTLENSWKLWTKQGLWDMPGGQPEADGQIERSMKTWTDESGVVLINAGRNEPKKELGWFRTTWKYTFEGNLSQIDRMMYRMHTSAIPLRIVELSYTPKDLNGTVPTMTVGITIESIYIDKDYKEKPRGGAAPQPDAG